MRELGPASGASPACSTTALGDQRSGTGRRGARPSEPVADRQVRREHHRVARRAAPPSSGRSAAAVPDRGDPAAATLQAGHRRVRSGSRAPAAAAASASACADLPHPAAREVHARRRCPCRRSRRTRPAPGPAARPAYSAWKEKIRCSRSSGRNRADPRPEPAEPAERAPAAARSGPSRSSGESKLAPMKRSISAPVELGRARPAAAR